MNEQPEALRLADALDSAPYSSGCTNEAAAELRRQHAEIERLRDAGVGYSQQTMDAAVREREKLREVNAELLEALKLAQSIIGHPEDAHSKLISAAIAKVEEVKP